MLFLLSIIILINILNIGRYYCLIFTKYIATISNNWRKSYFHVPKIFGYEKVD